MAQQELTYEEFCSKPMELVMHMSGEKEHYLHRINREIGVQKLVITPVKNGGYDFGTPRVFYILENDNKNYTTADQVYVAYMAKVCGVTLEEDTQ